MKDFYQNPVYFEDTEAWHDKFEVGFSLGSEFNTLRCVQFSGVEQSNFYKDLDFEKYRNYELSDTKIVCPFKPTYFST